MALPPTATKFSTDVNNVTTFFFDFPNFTGSHSGVTATLGVNSVAGGGTGLATLTANNVILGNGTSSPMFVAPGTAGNLLTSDGTTWISSPAGGGSANSTSKFGVNPSTSGTLSVTGNSPIVFPFVYYDTTSSYNATTGQWTAPADGYYDIVFTSFFTGASQNDMFLFQNGTVVAGRLGSNIMSNFDSQATQVFCTAGDILTVVPDNSTGLVYSALGAGPAGFIPTVTITRAGASGGGGSGSVTSVAMTVPSFLSVAGSPITSAGTLAVTLSGTALPSANGGTDVTSSGAAGNVLVSDGTNWISSPFFSGVSAFAAFASNQVTTDSGAIVTAGFSTFDNSPAFTFVPSITGTYKIYCSIPLESTSNANFAIARIFNTSGGATLLQESQGSNVSAGGSIASSTFVQSNYTLLAGVSYVFDIQGQPLSGTTVLNRGNISPFYMFAEGISLISGSSNIATFSNQQTSGTSGGATTNSIWNTTPLNTTDFSQSWAALSSNQITLQAGTYYFDVSSPSFGSDHFQTRLQNITDSTTSIIGSSEFNSSTTSTSQTSSFISGSITVITPKVFEIQLQPAAASSFGFGVQAGFGTEVYCRVNITKMA